MKRLAILTLLPAVFALSGCHEQELLRNLSEQQANEVVAVLQANDLSVQKQDQGKSGFAVAVGQTDFPAAVDMLQKYNLPSKARVEIAQSFPSDALVASPRAEQARLLSAVEQRLEQNLAAMKNIVSARVQVSYPLLEHNEGKGEPPMHVAVLLTYRNEMNHDVLVSEVKRFVKNSFENVDYDNISVVMYQAPSVFRTMATQPAANGRTGWLYCLLAVPAAVALMAISAMVFLRKRRQAKDKADADAGSQEAAPEAASDAAEAPSAPAAHALPSSQGLLEETNRSGEDRRESS